MKEWIKKLLHDILKWHYPAFENSWQEGINQVNYCLFCKKKILRDSQGNWF